MRYGREQLAEILRRAGWPESLIPIMVAIGLAESSGDNTSYRVCPGNGFCTVRQGGVTRTVPAVRGQGPESSAGLFQINLRAHPQYSLSRLVSDPIYNAQAALEIYRRQGLRAWGAYVDGRFRQFFSGSVPVGTGGNLFPGGADTVRSGVSSVRDWIFQPVQSAGDRFAPYLQRSAIDPRTRFQIAAVIMIVVLVFAWREF